VRAALAVGRLALALHPPSDERSEAVLDAVAEWLANPTEDRSVVTRATIHAWTVPGESWRLWHPVRVQSLRAAHCYPPAFAGASASSWETLGFSEPAPSKEELPQWALRQAVDVLAPHAGADVCCAAISRELISWAFSASANGKRRGRATTD